MKKKRFISRQVLSTELSYAMQCFRSMDFGTGSKIISDVLARVKEYDVVPPKKDELATAYNSVRDAIVALYGKWRIEHRLVDARLVENFVDFVQQQHP